MKKENNKNVSINDLVSFLLIKEIDDKRVCFHTLVKNKNGNLCGISNTFWQASYLTYDKLTLSGLIQVEKLKLGESSDDKFLTLPSGNFLAYSTFIETLSFHLCSMYSASNYEHLLIRQERYAKLDQAKRLEKIREICKDNKEDIKIINNELRDILEVRNQVAHNFTPTIIIYRKKEYLGFDEPLTTLLKEAIKKSINLLAKKYMLSLSVFLKENKERIQKEFLDSFGNTKTLHDMFLSCLNNLEQKGCGNLLKNN